MAWPKIIVSSGPWEGFPGPRDWSPRLQVAKEHLLFLRAMLPWHMQVCLEEVRECGLPEIVAMVEGGFGFIAKLGIDHHFVYVSPSGRLHMDQDLKMLFGLEGPARPPGK